MRIKLKGHETFALREGWLNKGLSEINKSNRAFSINYGADVLGVGSNMAKAIRYWLRAGGFTSESSKSGTKLTEIGTIVFEQDKYLEDNFALWIFHVNLAWNQEHATSWYLFFNELNVEDFTKEELTEQLMSRLTVLAEDKKVPERSVRDDVSVLLHMYTKEKIENYDPEEKKISPFSRLGILKRSGNRYRKIQPTEEEVHPLVVLYAMQKYFLRIKKDAAGIDELLQAPLSPGKILNLKRVALNEYIDRLAQQEYLIVNRTAGLDMVYMKTMLLPEQIVAEYYRMPSYKFRRKE